MDDVLLPQHPAWPSYFDVDVLVYDDDWTLAGSQLLLHPAAAAPWPPNVVEIASVTLLPDNLVFLRGRYVPDAEDADAPPETYYGIVSQWQYRTKQTQPQPPLDPV